jgi:hypothetical protein
MAIEITARLIISKKALRDAGIDTTDQHTIGSAVARYLGDVLRNVLNGEDVDAGLTVTARKVKKDGTPKTLDWSTRS